MNIMRISLWIVYVLINMTLIYSWTNGSFDSQLIFYGLLILNLFVLLSFELLNRARQHKNIIESKIKSQRQEMVLQVKSSQLETITSNLPFPLALMDHQGILVLRNANFDPFIIEDDELLTYDSKHYQQDVGNFIKYSFIKDVNQSKTLNINGIDFQALSIPITNKTGRAGCLFMFLDVTQIIDKERMQKRFIADASHELKTPLSVILGMTQILNRPGFNDSETQAEFLTLIETEALRMEGIVADLLSISKMSSNKVTLVLEPIVLRMLIQEIITPLKALISERKNTMVVDIDDSIVVSLDHEKAYQIFSNLLTNALKFTENGTITVRAEVSAPYCVISVEDTGIGIKEEDQKYIFERFYRADHSRSRTVGGSGLGLAIVKTYVLAHKGEIEVKSAVDTGSRFIVKLPM